MQKLYTPWGERLDRSAPLPEYPRPQFRRESFLNLNGVWRCAIRPDGEAPVEWDGEIVVPFSPESILSGVERQLKPEEALWYRRSFALPDGFGRGRTILHFGAADQTAEIWVNGSPVGSHAGGYLPFSFDISGALRDGENVLTVKVRDWTDGSVHAYGKQKYDRGGIWYTAQSGIWQTVWIESVPETYLAGLDVVPDFDAGTVRLRAETNVPAAPIEATVFEAGRHAAAGTFGPDGRCELDIPDFRPWSPEDPFLYDLEIRVGEDRVQSYFGMRKFGTVIRSGRRVLALNGKPIFMNGVLDQGYWSDGLYTPPSDEAMVFDIESMKRCGFNTLRKHIKIEPLRWYYHCDRLGMIVWQDLVSGGSPFKPFYTQVLPFLGIHLKDTPSAKFGRAEAAPRAQFERDAAATVAHLRNCVGLALWVPFNEGWGQFDSLRLAERVRELDPTRPVDHASGWYDQGGGDLKSRHVYYRPVRLKNDGRRVLALTEFGGYSLAVDGHHAARREFGYRMYQDAAAWMEAYRRLYEAEILPLIEEEGLSAAIYTQLSDVEDELNGLLTFDRRVLKADETVLRELNARLEFPRTT
jgi:hypothetical protein